MTTGKLNFRGGNMATAGYKAVVKGKVDTEKVFDTALSMDKISMAIKNKPDPETKLISIQTNF